MIGYCDQAQGSNRSFYQHYRSVGGHNGHFDFPPSGEHDWGDVGPAAGRDVRRPRHRRSSEPVARRIVAPGPPSVAGTLEGVQHTVRRRPRWSLRAVAVAASLVAAVDGAADRMHLR